MTTAVRPPPDFPPYVVRTLKPGSFCRECGKAGPCGFELLHTQRVEEPALFVPRPMLLVSRYPLCRRCKLAAESRSWVALQKVWADLAAAPQSILTHAAMSPAGGEH